ncbi:YciI family protein [Cellulomonas sp. PhB143]|uniref:YciI family protein n=1 Tax=Cellulomonas sp. PhB143 TaxID=2485186 RepID=UPI000F473C6D|nr:YciI family protein [Cellulomonas sp. PhB143]ROS78626.1 hypothetical protein EDF32_0525 [Cellulomonas sp. PhB143]
MRYLMLVMTDPTAPEPAAGTVPDVDEWAARNDASGARVMGERLGDPQDATDVRVRDGRLVVTDGPFAETKEQIAGFDIIEADGLDEAIGIAAAHPMAHVGMIELRPFWSGKD